MSLFEFSNHSIVNGVEIYGQLQGSCTGAGDWTEAQA